MMSPASLDGGGHLVISRRYNLLLMTALLCNALATLNDGASPLLNFTTFRHKCQENDSYTIHTKIYSYYC